MKYRWLLLVLKFRRLLLVVEETLHGCFMTRRIYWVSFIYWYLLLADGEFSQIMACSSIGIYYINEIYTKIQSRKFFHLLPIQKKNLQKSRNFISLFLAEAPILYSPKTLEKTKGFLVFSGGIK